MAQARPDVVLVDIRLPSKAGLAIGKAILEGHPEVKVLIVSAVHDPSVVEETLRAGFSGCLTKDTPLVRFLEQIEAVMRGDVVVPQNTRKTTAARSEEERHAAFVAKQLSPRELEVLSLLALGAGSSEMATALSVSPNTVRTHVQSIFTKLQVHSRLEAATFAVRHGLVKVGANGR